jgi:hypothetical protein
LWENILGYIFYHALFGTLFVIYLKKKQGGIENTSYRKKQPKVRCHIGEQVAKVTGAIDLSASFLVDPMSKLSLLP